MGNVVLRPLSKGELLDGAFTLYRRNFVTFLAVGLIFAIPQLVLTKVVPLAGVLLNGLLSLVLTGALIWIAAQATLGRTPTISGALKKGLQKCLPLLLSFFVVGILTFLGGLCLIVPMFFVMIMAFAVGPVVVVENQTNGFTRSRELAKRAWGHIALLTLVAFFITLLPTVGLALITALVNGVDTTSEASIARSTTDLMTILGPVISVLVGPFSQSLSTLMYFDQRVRKEGFGIEAQAAALGGAGPSAAPR